MENTTIINSGNFNDEQATQFEEKIDKLEKKLQTLENKIKQQQFAKIAFPCKEGYVFYPVQSILYFEAEGNYTLIHFEDGNTQIVSKQLKTIENGLEFDCFLRIHQSYLVNVNHIFKYTKGNNAFIIVTNGQKLSVARSRKAQMMEFIRKFD